MKQKPLTRRCLFCGKPHIIGKDYGAPYTDGLCDKAAEKMNAEISAKEKLK